MLFFPYKKLITHRATKKIFKWKKKFMFLVCYNHLWCRAAYFIKSKYENPVRVTSNSSLACPSFLPTCTIPWIHSHETKRSTKPLINHVSEKVYSLVQYKNFLSNLHIVNSPEHSIGIAQAALVRLSNCIIIYNIKYDQFYGKTNSYGWKIR